MKLAALQESRRLARRCSITAGRIKVFIPKPRRSAIKRSSTARARAATSIPSKSTLTIRRAKRPANRN